MRRAIAVADSTNAPIFQDIATMCQREFSMVWPDTISAQITPSSFQYLSRTQFRDIWNSGAAIVSFVGSANWYQFSPSAYFTTWDVDSLAQGSPLPFCLILSGQRFEKTDTPAIAVSLLETEGKGAIATLAPSGTIYVNSNATFLQGIADALATKPAKSLGEALVTTINNSGLWDQSTRRQTILGDPALVVRRVVLAGVNPIQSEVQGGFVLLQNYPNPFNPATTIRYALPARSHVTLSVYNMLGQQVATLVNGTEEAGYHDIRFDASGLASGVYFYRLRAGAYVATKEFLVLR
jgi:hypothetical protein